MLILGRLWGNMCVRKGGSRKSRCVQVVQSHQLIPEFQPFDSLKISCRDDKKRYTDGHSEAFLYPMKAHETMKCSLFVNKLKTCQDKCAEKSLFRTAGGQNVTKIPWLGPPPLEVWSAHFQGKVEMKHIPIFGRGSENVIKFSFWPLFVTKKCIFWFFSFYA